MVDYARGGFDCVYNETRSFEPWSGGIDMECAGPEDVEEELKACQNDGQVLPITLCTLNIPPNATFKCVNPFNQSFDITLQEADSFFCVSELDRKRLLERCHK